MPAQIVKILRIVDTRDFEEVNDRWVPIPGSGNARPCDRCNALHEIHVYVALDTGHEAIIGTGCADSPDMDKALRAVLSLDKTIRKHERTIAKLQAEMAQRLAVRAEVEALPLPEVEPAADGWYHMGDAKVRVWADYYGGFNTERHQCLIDNWRKNREAERGAPRFRSTYTIRAEIDATQDLLAKARTKRAAQA